MREIVGMERGVRRNRGKDRRWSWEGEWERIYGRAGKRERLGMEWEVGTEEWVWMEVRLERREGIRIEGVAGKEGKDRDGMGSVEQRRGIDGIGIGE